MFGTLGMSKAYGVSTPVIVLTPSKPFVSRYTFRAPETVLDNTASSPLASQLVGLTGYRGGQSYHFKHGVSSLVYAAWRRELKSRVP